MRGLQTDFSPECLSELARINGPARADGAPHIRDLRGLLWASIDNDDSEDLDQLTVAEPLHDGKARIRVAVADVDSLVHKTLPSTWMLRPTPPPSTLQPRYSPCSL